MATPNTSSEQAQALAVFNHAAEEIRFFKGQELPVTNYALIAYGALAVYPPSIHCNHVVTWFCAGVNFACAFAVLVTAAVAYRVLSSLDQAYGKELSRMNAARWKPPLVGAIHTKFRLVNSSAWWKLPLVKIRASSRRLDSGGDRRPGRVILVLRTVLAIGAVLAMLVNLLPLPWTRVAACLSAGR
jgi:hypothetical protein